MKNEEILKDVKDGDKLYSLPSYSFEKKTNKYNNNDHKKSIKNKIAKRRKR